MPEVSKGQAETAPTPKSTEDAILALLEDDEEGAENPKEDVQDGVQDEGQEPEEPGDEAEGAVEEPRYKVKIDGKEEEVPLSELVAGYQRQADYTRKTQRLAEERRRVTEEYQQAAEERRRYAAALQALEQQLVGQEPDWEQLQRENPAVFAAEFAAYQKRLKALEAIRKEQEALQVLAAQQQQELLQQRLEQERELLLAAIPEWVDGERATQERRALIEYGKSLGFTDEELNQIYDHRVVKLLRNAWLFDQARQKTAKIKDGQPAVKTAPPGGAKVNVTARKKAMERLSKTGSLEDAASVFEVML
jgi:hypothetical protein